MSEWERVRLDEAIALDVDAVPVTATAAYGIVGVLNRGRGLLFRHPIAGDETSYKTLNRIRPNQIVYSRLKAFEGAITVAPNDLGEVYASQEFPTFTCGERMLPEYFRLLTTTKRLWDQLQALSTGMGGRRERVKPADFLSIEVALPSVTEQRRIVDVMAAVDAQIEALAKEGDRVSGLLAALRAELASAADMRRLGEVLDVARAGGTPNRKRLDFYGGRIPWLKSGEVNNPDISETEEFLTEAGLDGSSAWLVPADSVVVAMYGATAGQVGYLRASMATNQAVLALRPKSEAANARFLFHWLSTRSVSLKQAAVGAAQPNLSKGVVLDRAGFPRMELPEQMAWVARLDALTAQRAAANRELVGLRALRSTLLTALLNQEIEIPESYDALLEEVS
ncbi:restriction endonuclease subunit S [Streptomyces sp. PA5.6]|uniref:restriction endonuclease subunit S n=1 Tax=Streptomyces sp. PA5.6 TaxID=3035651 RepID=UPI00390498E5